MLRVLSVFALAPASSEYFFALASLVAAADALDAEASADAADSPAFVVAIPACSVAVAAEVEAPSASRFALAALVSALFRAASTALIQSSSVPT